MNSNQVLHKIIQTIRVIYMIFFIFAINSWLLELRHNVTAFSADLGTYLLWLYIISSTLLAFIFLIAHSFQWDTYIFINTLLFLMAASLFTALLMTDIMAGLDKIHPLFSYNRSVYVLPFLLILIGRFFKKTKGTKLRTIGCSLRRTTCAVPEP